MKYVALLRGINVGGNNIIPMKDLVRMIEGIECTDVSTYIQSGNVVLTATAPIAAKLPTAIAKGIASRFGCTVPVMIRSATELRAIAKRNPFLERGESTDALHLMFLADKPSAKVVAMLDSARSPNDEFAVKGSEIYLFCPNGVGKTKLTNDYFDRTLGTKSTGRNWRTVEKLLAMTGA